MKVINPSYITDGTLVSYSIDEEDVTYYPEWDADNTYQTGQRVCVMDSGVHKVYEATSALTENSNKYPPDWLYIRTDYETVYWIIISATNLWKLFDMIVAPDRCVVPEGDALEVVTTPGDIDTIAILNVDAVSVTITLTDDEAVVYTDTITPDGSVANNIIFDDIPSYPDASVTITINTSAGNTVRVGEIIYGKIKTLGTVAYGVNVSIQDFSQKETDVYGNFSILERVYSKRLTCSFFIPIEKHSGVFHFLQKNRAVPLVWIISDLYTTTSLYGFYREFSMTLNNPSIADCSITVEGLGGDLINETIPEDDYEPPWDGSIKLWTFPLPPTIEPTTGILSPAPVSESIDDLITFDVPSFALIVALYNPIGTCTVSNAEPAVVTLVAHGLANDDIIIFHTTGALPSPLVVDRDYFVKNKGDDTFNIALTISGSTIDTTNAGSGTHTLLAKA